MAGILLSHSHHYLADMCSQLISFAPRSRLCVDPYSVFGPARPGETSSIVVLARYGIDLLLCTWRTLEPSLGIVGFEDIAIGDLNAIGWSVSRTQQHQKDPTRYCVPGKF